MEPLRSDEAHEAQQDDSWIRVAPTWAPPSRQKQPAPAAIPPAPRIPGDLAWMLEQPRAEADDDAQAA